MVGASSVNMSLTDCLSDLLHSGDPTSKDSFRSERLLARFGHSMLYDADDSTIYIMSGQRRDLYMADLWAIKLASPDDESHATLGTGTSQVWRQGAIIDSPFVSAPDRKPQNRDQPSTVSSSSNANSAGNVVNDSTTIGPVPSPARQPIILQIRPIASDYSLDGAGPPAAFTQRALLDPTTREWAVLSGLVRDRQANCEVPGGEVWVWVPTTPQQDQTLDDLMQGDSDDELESSTTAGTWMRVEQRGIRPEPRYAAQVVLDPLRGEHYLFGGNPNHLGDEPRLNDLWRLKIVR